jgi:hypothetical protein
MLLSRGGSAKRPLPSQTALPRHIRRVVLACLLAYSREGSLQDSIAYGGSLEGKMRRQTVGLSLVSSLFGLSLLTAGVTFWPILPAMADPGDQCTTTEDCDTGERCKIPANADKGVCVTRKSPPPRNQGADDNNDNPGNNGRPQNQPPRGGHYCCDSLGNSRCLIPTTPIGAGCFCYGQGNGQVCR